MFMLITQLSGARNRLHRKDPCGACERVELRQYVAPARRTLLFYACFIETHVRDVCGCAPRFRVRGISRRYMCARWETCDRARAARSMRSIKACTREAKGAAANMFDDNWWTRAAACAGCVWPPCNHKRGVLRCWRAGDPTTPNVEVYIAQSVIWCCFFGLIVR